MKVNSHETEVETGKQEFLLESCSPERNIIIETTLLISKEDILTAQSRNTNGILYVIFIQT